MGRGAQHEPHRRISLLARGGAESGADQFRWMAAAHALFLPCCAAEVLLLRRPFPGAAGWVCAAGALCAQGLRWWAISALGWRWNVRVIVVPGDAPVRRGPYRFLRHPNYVAVAVETLAVDLSDRALGDSVLLSLAAMYGALPRAAEQSAECWLRDCGNATDRASHPSWQLNKQANDLLPEVSAAIRQRLRDLDTR